MHCLPIEVETDPITINMTGYASMLAGKGSFKQEVVDELCWTVFPWWDHEVIRCRVGGKPRPFRICLVAGDGTEGGREGLVRTCRFRISRVGDEDEETLFRDAWFCPGDGVLPKRAERTLEKMAPGETCAIVLTPDEYEKTCICARGWHYSWIRGKVFNLEGSGEPIVMEVQAPVKGFETRVPYQPALYEAEHAR